MRREKGSDQRSGRRPGRRWGFVAAAVALACGGAAALAEDGQGGAELQQMEVVLRPEGGGAALLRLRGTGNTDSEFESTGRIMVMPCPGRYEFVATGANLETNTHDRYTAILHLRSGSRLTRRPRCGGQLGKRVGSDGTRLEFIDGQGERPIELRNGRQLATGVITGDLSVLTYLCPERYRFVARFRHRDRLRAYRYRLRVVKADFDGEAVRCQRPGPTL